MSPPALVAFSASLTGNIIVGEKKPAVLRRSQSAQHAPASTSHVSTPPWQGVLAVANLYVQCMLTLIDIILTTATGRSIGIPRREGEFNLEWHQVINYYAVLWRAMCL